MATERILIVDDEETLCEVLQLNLENEGYDVDIAFSAEQALAYDLKNYSLILLDIMMGKVSGIKMAKTLRADVATAEIPIIFCTARDSEDDMVMGLNLGADDYITKPFSAPELLARIRAVLRRRTTVAEGPANVYTVGGFSIDFDKRVVTVDGQPVRLTQVEYRIVELIARQPGKVLTYSHIINHIWGPYADAENNRILRVNMSNIRRKIEQDRMAPQYILTEIGIGYRMAE